VGIGHAVHQHRPRDDFRQLRSDAAEVRLRAIRSQIALAFTFCSVAESEVSLGHPKAAHRVVEKLQKLAATVHRHLNLHGHVPPSEVAGLRGELVRLESRIRAVEERERSN